MNHEQKREQSKQLVRRYLNAISAWDFEVFEEILHPDMTWEMPWYINFESLKVSGKDNVLAFYRECAAQLPEPGLHEIHPDTLASDPEKVFVTFRSQMLLNGASYSNEYVGVAQVADGQMLSMREYTNPLNNVASQGGEIVYPASAKPLQLSEDILS